VKIPQIAQVSVQWSVINGLLLWPSLILF